MDQALNGSLSIDVANQFAKEFPQSIDAMLELNAMPGTKPMTVTSAESTKSHEISEEYLDAAVSEIMAAIRKAGYPV
jgi:DNA-binding IscR family transcriptional regulator